MPGKVYRYILIIAVETGMRKSEILGLTEGEVDLARERIILNGNRTKTGSSRVIPLTPRAVDTLRAALAYKAQVMWRKLTPPHEFVFVSPRTGRQLAYIDRWWWTFKRRHRVRDLRFHDLRHTFATWAAQRGVPAQTIQAILGHRTSQMTSRYIHPSDEALDDFRIKFGGGSSVVVTMPSETKTILERAAAAAKETPADVILYIIQTVGLDFLDSVGLTGL